MSPGEPVSAGRASAPATTPSPTQSTRLFLRWFGKAARRNIAHHPQLGIKLHKARNPLVPHAYLATLYGSMLVTGIAMALPFVAYAVYTGFLREASVAIAVPLAALPAVAVTMVYSYQLLKPDLEIASRRRRLEANLPYALNFMAALASAGVVPVEVFGALAVQNVYGVVAEEAAWIYRDAKVFSKDLVGALQAAARRSPSQQWEEFLQGSVNTITSGGDLKSYLLAKSEQFTQDNRRKMKAFLESMGVMAESYVVVAAAAPLFLIVILSVMMLLRSGGDPTLFLNLLVLLFLPALHIVFTYILRTMRAD